MKILLLYSRSVRHQQRPNLFQCGPTDLHYIILRLENTKSSKGYEEHTYGMVHFHTTFPEVWQYLFAQLSGKLKFLWTVQPEVLLNTYRKIPKLSPLPLKNKPSERNAHTTHLRMRFDQSRRQSPLFFWSAPSTQTLINP